MIFREPPADFDKSMEIVACYVEHGGEFILLHRHPHKSNGNRWGLPAGKVDSGETKHQAMAREIREETGLEISEEKLNYFDSLYVRHEGRDFFYHMFSTALEHKPDVVISPKEHKAYIWTSPRDSLGMDLIFDLDECTKLFYQL